MSDISQRYQVNFKGAFSNLQKVILPPKLAVSFQKEFSTFFGVNQMNVA